ncbi:MAG: hypothetical protein JRI80_00020 [Deltaproteobacteria bacterium]|nr:hypothetical protein [Deltaproteobacteria bacterium]
MAYEHKLPENITNKELRLRGIERAIRIIASRLQDLMVKDDDLDLGYIRDDLGEINSKWGNAPHDDEIDRALTERGWPN